MLSKIERFGDLIGQVEGEVDQQMRNEYRLLELGRPQYYDEFIAYHGHEIQYSPVESLFNTFRELDFSDAEKRTYQLDHLLYLLQETICHIAAGNVATDDYFLRLSCENDMDNSTYLGLLQIISSLHSTMRYWSDLLYDECKKRTDLWPMPEEDEDKEDDEEEREEEKIPLNEHCDFLRIQKFLNKVFPYYIQKHPDAQVEQYFKKTMESVEHFMNDEDLEEVSFSFVTRGTSHMHYLDISIDSGTIDLSDGGHVYDPDVGGDGYTNWMFTLWKNGETDGDLYLNTAEVMEMIDDGAYLTGEGLPEEDEDEEDYDESGDMEETIVQTSIF